MLIDFKIRALFIWTDPYLPDLVNNPIIKFHTIAQLTPSPHIKRFPLTQFPLT